jgi:branched-subunit amino acid ABC-type transport system permease component
MSGNFYQDNIEAPFILGHLTVVVLFVWSCLLNSKRNERFISSRLVLAILMPLVSTSLTWFRLQKCIPRTGQSYVTDVSALDNALEPFQRGIVEFVLLLMVHTALWWIQRKSKAGKATSLCESLP